MQEYAKKIELRWASGWVNNYESCSPLELGPFGDNMDPLIERTLSSLERYFNSTAEQLILETKMILKEISNMIHTPAFKEAIGGLACHSNGIETKMTDILTMIKQKFNAHQEESSEERTLFVTAVLYESITKKLLQTISDVLQHFKPDLEKFYTMMNELNSGQNSKLEHLILRTLEEMQTDRFLQRMGLLFKDICQTRRTVIGSILQTTVENLDYFLSRHSLLNFKTIFGMLLITDHWAYEDLEFEPLGKILSDGLDAIKRKLKDETLDNQMVSLIYNLVLPDCDPRPECEEILLENKPLIDYQVFSYINNLDMYFSYLTNVNMNHGYFLSILFN